MIEIAQNVYTQMIEHANAGYPNEACGILAGPPLTAAGGNEKATVFFPMKNLDESSISYFMDPKDQLIVFKKMRETGVEMKGIFHSHVSSEAYPSQKDVRLAFYPDASYLIVSLAERKKPILRSFKIVEERVTEQKIRTV